MTTLDTTSGHFWGFFSSSPKQKTDSHETDFYYTESIKQIKAVFVETPPTQEKTSDQGYPLFGRVIDFFVALMNQTIHSTAFSEVMIETIGSVSRVCAFFQPVEGIVPYFAIATLPFHLVRSGRESYAFLKLFVLAVKVNYVGYALLFVIQGVDRALCTLSLVNRIFLGGVSFRGVESLTFCYSFFSIVLPILMIVFSAVTAIGDTISLLDNLRVLKDFNKKAREGPGKLAEYFQGPAQPPEDADAQTIAKYKVDKWLFDFYHSTSDKRFTSLQEQFVGLNKNLTDVNTLESNAQKFQELLGVARGEIHRKIMYQFLGIVMALMTIAAATLYMVNSKKYFIEWTVLSFTSSGIYIARYLFDKTITKEQFAFLDRGVMFLTPCLC